MKNYSKLTLPLFGLALAATAAQGAVIGQLGVLDDSTGLNAGDQYRLIFLTLGTTNARSSDITTYNAFVQAEAAASTTFSSLGNGTWNIVGSTLAVDARDNTGTNPNVDGTGVPVFLMDGTTLIAATNADLWNNGIDANVAFDQNGDPLSDNRTFTGSNGSGVSVGAGGGGGNDGDGTGSGDTALGVLDGQGVQTGNSANNNQGWMLNFKSAANNTNSVYAMSDILTVPIPEPSSAVLLGLGGLALVFRRRK